MQNLTFLFIKVNYSASVPQCHSQPGSRKQLGFVLINLMWSYHHWCHAKGGLHYLPDMGKGSWLHGLHLRSVIYIPYSDVWTYFSKGLRWEFHSIFHWIECIWMQSVTRWLLLPIAFHVVYDLVLSMISLSGFDGRPFCICSITVMILNWKRFPELSVDFGCLIH